MNNGRGAINKRPISSNYSVNNNIEKVIFSNELTGYNEDSWRRIPLLYALTHFTILILVYYLLPMAYWLLSTVFAEIAIMEGPSLVILKEQAAKFVGKKVTVAYGTQKINFERLTGQRVTDLKTWGKHFLILFEDCTVRIHYLMFGNYYLDAKHPEKQPKLALEFSNGEWNNYNCAAKILEGTDMDALYDWSTDVMLDAWDPEGAKKKLRSKPHSLVCDALLDQAIFSGVGNIIKNEVFYRIRIHPESEVGALPTKQLNQLIKEARNYSFDFYNWKKEGALRKHWLAHTKKECQRCGLPLVKQHTGLSPRRSFFCNNCQILYQLPK